MLRLENIDLYYGSFQALEQVSISANTGELVVLLGANGAGKSSVFRAVSGLSQPKAGDIFYESVVINGLKPAQRVSRGIVQCPEGRKLFPRMSVLQNLMLGAYVHHADKVGNQQRLDEVMTMFPILEEKKHDAAGSLSGGQQQMVAIGRAMMSRPQLLLLDEPSLGLAPLVVHQMFEAIQRINQEGTTIVLAEQNAYAALKIAHRAYVMELGKIVLEGDPESLLSNEEVRRAYIGA